jgi:hypothetical protein|tara:strand:+ start:72 stop:203 length:132 start_codon:yes stop_codon:yes gene_type:complete
MTLSKGNKRKVKKVVKGLNKSAKTHAGQAKTLKAMLRTPRKKS